MFNRREFLYFAAGSALTVGSSQASDTARPLARFKAVVFDAFPIFDPRPIATLAETLFPGQGSALMNSWRVRQFDYQWLRALGGHYADFLQATEEGLLFGAKQLRLNLSQDKRQQLMAAWSELQVWPEVPEAVNALHSAGLRLAFLSNMTAPVLQRGLERARLDGAFEAVLSTDQIRTFKPDPRAYAMATDRLRLTADEILFVAFAGWDVAGAKWFGYPTFWVNRLGAPTEELGVAANASGEDLSAVVRYIIGSA